ncbi:unnamed protein product [Macrosiphum euphorbiae]|uniref:PIPK domain-containing protein n=1 Tax=Macrosiphum euphorbiae TaxID=13131 RepID=A0AAV0XQB3_9HEMI|nr:unnamed protein product [Macrosiphum euphorbiae]
MMINTSSFSKGLIIFLVTYLTIISTVTSNTETEGENASRIVEKFITVSGPSLEDLLAKNVDMEFNQKLVDDNEEILTKQQIMDSIQLGVKYEMEKRTQPVPDSFPDDFKDISMKMFYNWRDINNNNIQDFSYSTYAPSTFHYLRHLFGIGENDYVTSFCKSPLRELANPTNSKSILYLTSNDKFIMKTLQHTEYKSLLGLLFTYTKYLNENRESLLPKLSGFSSFQSKSTDIKLISINNLLPSDIKIHQKFDLKGSTVDRKATDKERKKKLPTFKDVDFNYEFHHKGIFLKPDTYLAFVKTIEKDSEILKEFNIMDYSILIGVHYIDSPLQADENTSTNEALRKAATDRWESLMADSVEDKSIQAETWNLSDKNHASLSGSIPAKSVYGDRLLLFVGFIDILQPYHLLKNLNYRLKAFKLKVTPGETETADCMSIQNPVFYASRFLKYMTDTVFRPMLSPQELEKLSQQPVDMKLSSKRGCAPSSSMNISDSLK